MPMKAHRNFTTTTLAAALAGVLALPGAALAQEQPHNGHPLERERERQAQAERTQQPRGADEDTAGTEITVEQEPPEVIIEQPEPQVRVEQEEPEVQIEQAQPEVRTEQAQQEQQEHGADAAQAAAGREQAQQLSRYIGEPVLNAQGEEIGQVERIVRDPRDQSLQVVASTGGLLGLGGQNVVIPADQLQAGPEGLHTATEMTQQQLEQMPEYQEERYQDVAGAADATAG